ncbi:MAG: hypothetical protein GMKNLPBB_01925 [Myxococcota bacterium]|nr:hypothetical protein [Myxococcota bacterium]
MRSGTSLLALVFSIAALTACQKSAPPTDGDPAGATPTSRPSPVDPPLSSTLAAAVEPAPDTAAPPAPTAAAANVVLQAHGEVTALDLNRVSRPLNAGAELAPGETVKTGRKSRVELKLADGSTLWLASNAMVSLVHPSANREKEPVAVALLFGRMFAKVTRATNKHPFEVHTATAVAGIRGTEFAMNVGMDGAVLLAVKNGVVELGGRQSRVRVGEQEASEVEPGKDPTPPRKIEFAAFDWNKWQKQRIANAFMNADRIAKDNIAGALAVKGDLVNAINRLDDLRKQPAAVAAADASDDQQVVEVQLEVNRASASLAARAVLVEILEQRVKESNDKGAAKKLAAAKPQLEHFKIALPQLLDLNRRGYDPAPGKSLAPFKPSGDNTGGKPVLNDSLRKSFTNLPPAPAADGGKAPASPAPSTTPFLRLPLAPTPQKTK